MTYVRWFGVVFAAVSIPIQPHYPDALTRELAWVVAGTLAFGSVAIWGALARIDKEANLQKLGAVAFAFDCLIVMSFVWLYAYQDPYVAWALLFVLPMEAALRYRLRGALVAAIGVGVFFIPQSFHVAALNDEPVDLPTYVFVIGLSVLLAAIAGSMAENWHDQKVLYVQQSLKLAEVDKLKDRFLAVTSHEIRGPLTAIITGVDTVKKRLDRLSDDQRDHILEMVSAQGHQLARLVDDLTTTSQLQEGKFALQVDWFDLEVITNQALEAAASKRRGHILELFVEPLKCELDGSRLVQIIRNLVENAYKYTPDVTQVAVTIKATERGIVLEVADEGTGIPVDKRDQLFEAFSRIEETAAGQEGIGLGLYLVSQLVALMKGRIDLTSSSRGTTFAIHIPCKTIPLDRPQLGLVPQSEEG
jgi:signal transduction histidine kinase